jgi:hypothetical protein
MNNSKCVNINNSEHDDFDYAEHQIGQKVPTQYMEVEI